jgi:hypothetical protein
MPTRRILLALVVALGLAFGCAVAGSAHELPEPAGGAGLPATHCLDPLCNTGAGPGAVAHLDATVQSSPAPADSCVQSASCVGGGAIVSWPALALLLLAGGVIATQVPRARPRRLRRFTSSLFALPGGVPSSLLRPPRVV